MNRPKKILRNIGIIIISAFLFHMFSGLHLTALGAHKNSERTANYGPSEIVHIEEFSQGKYFLGKYDKWFSCNTVNKSLKILWRFGNQVHGEENDLSKALSYGWSSSDYYAKFFGIINDDRIVKVELVLGNDEVFTTEEFYEDMFLMTWDDDSGNEGFKEIRAYDINGSLIFEDILF